MARVADTLDKFKGTLLGCAVGDALGAPVEGLPPEVIAQKYGRVADFIDERFGAGRITDDTQMTVVLAQSIIEYGRFDIKNTGFKFGRWMELSDNGIKEARGVGMACAEACRRLYRGVGPDESGVDSAGCGAAMRVSPVGLAYSDNPGMLLEAAVGQASITHTDPEAMAGAAAVAFAVALGVRGAGRLDRRGFIERTAAFTAPISEKMAGRIAGLSEYLDAGPEEGFRYTGNGGYVMETVPAALFSFLRTPDDFEESVVTAVNAGGDADSIGAIAGAVSGAFNGAAAIPARWVDKVEGRKYLEGLAAQLFTMIPSLKQKEKPVCL